MEAMKNVSPSVKKGWALLRVSSKDQAEVQHGSLEQQRHMIERWQIEQLESVGCDYQVTRVVEEEKSGKKGSFSKRKDFQELLHAIHSNLIDFVVFEKVDRMGRWQIANLQLIEAASERGVEVHFIDDGKFNYKDRGKRLSFNVKNIFAEDYSLELEEKITKKQREAMINNGKDTSTRPVLGLDPHPTKVGFYLLNRSEQVIAVDIFSKFCELKELFATIMYCNDKGYKTKENWVKEKIDKNGTRIPPRKVGGEEFTSESLRSLLTNPKMRGFGFFKDTWNQFSKLRDSDGLVKWEYGYFKESGPVVPTALFDNARRFLDLNKHKVSKPEAKGEVYLLSGALELPNGTRFVGAAGKSGQYRYYEDRKNRQRAEIRIPKEEIEEAICKRVKQYLKDSGLLEKAIETTFQGLDTEIDKIEQGIRSQQSRLLQLQQTTGGFSEYLRKAALTGELGKVTELITAEQEKVDAETQVITAQLCSLESRKSSMSERHEKTILQDKMRRAMSDFSKRCDRQKQQIIQAIIPKIIVHPNNRLEIKINPLFMKSKNDKGPLSGAPERFNSNSPKFVLLENGDPTPVRTGNPQLRRLMLYPVELWGHATFLYDYTIF
jgi:DNA invertase Pin-like site-specific DNA recombinase